MLTKASIFVLSTVFKDCKRALFAFLSLNSLLLMALSGCARFQAQGVNVSGDLESVAEARCLGTLDGGDCSRTSLDQFEGLSFSIFVGESRGSATASSDIDVDVRLQGRRLRGDGRTSVVDFSLTQSRFSETGEDLLLRGDIWSFQIQSEPQNLLANVYCLEKFICNQVIINLVWQENDHYYTEQFHVDNQLYLQGDESLNITEGTLPGEVHSRYKTPDVPFTLTESETGPNSDGLREALARAPSEDLIPSRQGSILLVDEVESFSALTFDFGSLLFPSTFGFSLPSQARGHQRDGSLVDADQLIGPSTDFCVTRPQKAFGTKNTIRMLQTVAHKMMDEVGDPLGVGNIALEGGGKVAAPSVSHQNGLDIDLYFYQENLQGSACQSPDAVADPTKFDPLKNYILFKTIFQTAQSVDGRGRRFSYFYNAYVHRILRDRMCEAAIEYEGINALRDPSTDAFQTMRRIFADDIYHKDHAHIRLNCHSIGCRDVGADLTNTNPCG